eukprot:518378_1
MLNLSFRSLHLLKKQFSISKCVRLNDGWLNESISRQLINETNIAINKHSIMMDIILNKATRNLRIVSGDQIMGEDEFPNINMFADNEEIIEFIRFMTDNQELKSGKQPQLYPAHINYEHKKEQHHGWHLDDAAFKIVICAKYSPADDESINGGCVQYIPNSIDNDIMDKSLSERLRSMSDSHKQLLENGEKYTMILDKKIPNSMIKTLHLREGDAYLLNGRTVLHQVLPLKSDDTQRAAICFSYDYIHDFSNYEHSAASLYAGLVKQDYA